MPISPLNHKKRTSSHLIWLNRYFRGGGWSSQGETVHWTVSLSLIFRLRLQFASLLPESHPLNHKKRTSYDVLFWWKGVDSDHRSDNATDLQSAPFGRSGTLPYIKLFGGPSGTRTPDQPVMSR